MCVPCFNFVGLTVPKKSATKSFQKKSLQTHKRIYGKAKSYILPIYIVYRGIIKILLQSFKDNTLTQILQCQTFWSQIVCVPTLLNIIHVMMERHRDQNMDAISIE